MKNIQLKTTLPGPESVRLMAERQKHVAKGPFHSTPIFVTRGKGALLEDVDGNTLIDFAAGIGVANCGHAPESVVNAIREQAANLLHSSFNVVPSEGYAKLSARLNALTPGTYAKKTLLVNSGAEAVENAIKIARAKTGRQAIVCFEHAYHGRTYMAMSLTSKAKPYKAGFGPFNPEVYRVPFPYAYRWQGKNVSEECFAHFADVVTHELLPHNVAAVIIEPVLGEGGFIPAPPAFMRKLRDFCTEHGIVLVADEIQTGFGRTGTLFACEQLGITPDLMTLAKGLGGGLPIAAVVGKAEIMDGTVDGGIGGTYGGNPVACAAALAALDIYTGPAFLPHTQKIADTLQKRLHDFKEKFAVVGDVRGLGPMQAMELVKDKQSQEPHREFTSALAKYCYQHGLITITAGTYGNVIRLLPPLVIELAQLNEGLDVLEAGLKELGK